MSTMDPGPRSLVSGVRLLLLWIVCGVWTALLHAEEPQRPAPRPSVRSAIAALSSGHTERRVQALETIAGGLPLEAIDRGPVLRSLATLVRRAPSAAERVCILEVLQGIGGPDAEEVVLSRLDPAEEADERVWAAVFGGFESRSRDVRLARVFLERLQARDTKPAHRALLYEALGGLELPLAVSALSFGLPEETWVEAAGRARGLARQAGAERIRQLILLLGHASAAVRRAAWEGLAARTGAALPAERAVWEAWRAKWIAEHGGLEPAGETPAGGYAHPTAIHVPHYYGVPIPRPGSAVVFCLDTSQSMWGTFIDLARGHLRATLEDMPSTHRFEIVAFNEHVFSFAGRIVSAHPVVKDRAIRWFEGLDVLSFTNLYDAVERAYGLAGRGPQTVEESVPLDAVFLLSDGAPNRGRYRDGPRIVAGLAALSEGDVPIHCICVREAVAALLNEIAGATGGVFVDAFE